MVLTVLIIVVSIFFGFMLLACCVGCWSPLWRQHKRRDDLENYARARQTVGGMGNTGDGAFSVIELPEQTSEAEERSSIIARLDHVLARDAFKGREEALYTLERIERRRARAQGVMRSSEGVTLPVQIRHLKGKMKALSKTLTSSEVLRQPSEQLKHNHIGMRDNDRAEPDVEGSFTPRAGI